MCGISHIMIESLKKIGLNETEAKIYLQLVKKGSMTAIDLAKETKIHRRTIYDNLNILINKGFVNYYVEKQVKYFQANNPKILKKKQEEKLIEVDKILPTLTSYYKTPKKNPCVEILKGIEGGKTILHDLENTNKEIYWFGGGFKIIESLKYKEKILEALSKLKLRIIQPATKKKNFEKYFPNTKFIPSKYASNTAFFIYGDTVVTGTIVNDDFFMVKMTSSDISKAYVNIFELLWDN